jgi:hypothetical protein
MEILIQGVKDLLVNGLSLLLLLGLTYYIFPKILLKSGYRFMSHAAEPIQAKPVYHLEEEVGVIERYADLVLVSMSQSSGEDSDKNFENAFKDLVVLYERTFGEASEKDKKFLGIVLTSRSHKQ